MSTYWCEDGKYQKIYNIIKEHIPIFGSTGVLELELIRAVSKIYADYHNNGFGNNWVGAWNFINDEFSASIKYDLDVESELDAISSYSRGVYIGNNNYIERVLESLVDKSLKMFIERELIKDDEIVVELLTKYDNDFNEGEYISNHEYDDEIDNEYYYDDSDD